MAAKKLLPKLKSIEGMHALACYDTAASAQIAHYQPQSFNLEVKESGRTKIASLVRGSGSHHRSSCPATFLTMPPHYFGIFVRIVATGKLDSILAQFEFRRKYGYRGKHHALVGVYA